MNFTPPEWPNSTAIPPPKCVKRGVRRCLLQISVADKAELSGFLGEKNQWPDRSTSGWGRKHKEVQSNHPRSQVGVGDDDEYIRGCWFPGAGTTQGCALQPGTSDLERVGTLAVVGRTRLLCNLRSGCHLLFIGPDSVSGLENSLCLSGNSLVSISQSISPSIQSLRTRILSIQSSEREFSHL